MNIPRPYIPRSFRLIVALLILLAGCGIPVVPVRQKLDRADEYTVGGRRVLVLRARDFRMLDTSERILRYEYLPVVIHTVLDKRDSVEYMVVGAWQEYLWRFSERLGAVDKQYYAPVPLAFIRSGDSATITWGYPNVEGRDRDLKYVVRRRNDYWSVDLFRMSSARGELHQGVLKSYPQFESYDPFSRFMPGGPYERALPDTMEIHRLLRESVHKVLAGDGVDTTERR